VRLFKKTNIDFLGITKTCLGVSLALIALGTIALIVKGPNWGVDFTGGAQIVYGFASTPDEDQVRKIVESAKLNVTSVQRFDRAEKNQILLRMPQEKKEGRDVSGEVTAALTAALFPAGKDPSTLDLNLNGQDVLVAKLVAEDPEQLNGKPDKDPKVEYGREAEALIKFRSENGLFKSVDQAASAPGISPAVATWLKAKTVTGPFTLLSAETVGPQVGRDLRQKGLLAVFFSWAAMLAYIAFRFRSASFGTAAVVALIHDTWITLGVCAAFNMEISLTVVAAFLTLIGYSVNDTVVVFDRIRENLAMRKKEPLGPLVNRSINETLSRTVLTSTLTFLVTVVLFFMGGETLRGFSFVLTFGIIVGTYSSIFIAAPLVVAWEDWKAKRAGNQASAASAKNGKTAPAKAR
jgi:preprotein translocase subunit SecF